MDEYIKPDFSSAAFKIEIPTDDEGRDYFQKCISDEGISNHLRRNARFIHENFNSIKTSFTLECGIIKLSENLLIIHMGGEPVCEIKFKIAEALSGNDIIFAGYTDACAYIVTDGMIDEDGYEVRCFLEYMHKGRIKKGLSFDSLFFLFIIIIIIIINKCPAVNIKY